MQRWSQTYRHFANLWKPALDRSGHQVRHIQGSGLARLAISDDQVVGQPVRRPGEGPS